jgi:hypothetical protein
MHRLLPNLLAAAFVAATFSAYAAEDAEEEQANAPTVDQTANPMDQTGQGDRQSSGTGDLEQGGNSVERGDPTGTSAPGGDVTSPLPTGAGRSDNQ